MESSGLYRSLYTFIRDRKAPTFLNSALYLCSGSLLQVSIGGFCMSSPIAALRTKGGAPQFERFYMVPV